MGSDLTWSECMTWECVTDFVSRHLFLIVIVLALVAKQWGSRSNAKMMEIEGSKVKKIANPKEWEENIGKSEGKLIVVDFFATWCGPCVRAAPVFAQLSIDMENDPIEFWKVDVDQASVISRAEGISCMPTFKFFRTEGGKLKPLEVVQGFNEAKIKSLISKYSGK